VVGDAAYEQAVELSQFGDIQPLAAIPTRHKEFELDGVKAIMIDPSRATSRRKFCWNTAAGL